MLQIEPLITEDSANPLTIAACIHRIWYQHSLGLLLFCAPLYPPSHGVLITGVRVANFDGGVKPRSLGRCSTGECGRNKGLPIHDKNCGPMWR